MINYSSKVFKAVKNTGDKEIYAYFHPEVEISKPEYETTGRYLVVLLHPDKGLQTFYLNREKDGDNYVMDENSPAIIEEEWQEWCSSTIQAKSLEKQNSL